MAMSQAQKVGVGALLGGVGTMGASMLLRYYADNEPLKNGNGEEGTAKEPKFPVWWEQAPLIGIVAGAAATGLAYYLWGTEAAVAAGLTSVFTGVAPGVDGWVLEKRGEKDEKAKKEEAAGGAGAETETPGLRGRSVRALGARLQSLQAQLNAMAARAA